MLICDRHCEERNDEAIQLWQGDLDCRVPSGLAMTEERMIARHWQGRVPAEKAGEYLRLMKEVGLADYRSTAGNRGAWCLHRREAEVVHVEMFTLWEDLEAIRGFAGDELTKAKYYEFDPDFLLEMEPEVEHLEVVDG
jgi:hypothetical protein